MEGAKLIAHRGAEIVTREQLAQYEPPPATDTFKPVGHAQLVETLTQVMQDRGLHITKEQFAVQGHKLFFTFDLEWMKMEEYGAAFCCRHANDRSMPVTCGIGVRTFICDNMALHADMVTTRRHTSKLDLGEEMDRAVYRYMQGYRKFQTEIEAWHETKIEPRKGVQMIYDAFRKQLVPLKLFHPIAESWETATKNRDLSVWRLNNCFSEHTKTLEPGPAFRAHARLGKYFHVNFEPIA